MNTLQSEVPDFINSVDSIEYKQHITYAIHQKNQYLPSNNSYWLDSITYPITGNISNYYIIKVTFNYKKGKNENIIIKYRPMAFSCRFKTDIVNSYTFTNMHLSKLTLLLKRTLSMV